MAEDTEVLDPGLAELFASTVDNPPPAESPAPVNIFSSETGPLGHPAPVPDGGVDSEVTPGADLGIDPVLSSLFLKKTDSAGPLSVSPFRHALNAFQMLGRGASQLPVSALEIIDTVDHATTALIGKTIGGIGRLAGAPPEFSELATQGAERAREQSPQNARKAAEGLNELRDKYLSGDPELQNNFESQFFEGLGQVAPMVFGAALMRGGMALPAALERYLPAKFAAVLPELVGAGAVGGVMGAGEGIERAQQADAEIGKEFTSMLLFGAMEAGTEAIPIARVFSRLNKATGGRLRSALANGVQTGFEEALQEALAGAGGELIAQELLGETAQYFPAITESAKVGGAVGLTYGLILSLAFGNRGRRRLMNATDPELDDQADRTRQPIDGGQAILRDRQPGEPVFLPAEAGTTVSEIGKILERGGFSEEAGTFARFRADQLLREDIDYEDAIARALEDTQVRFERVDEGGDLGADQVQEAEELSPQAGRSEESIRQALGQAVQREDIPQEEIEGLAGRESLPAPALEAGVTVPSAPASELSETPDIPIEEGGSVYVQAGATTVKITPKEGESLEDAKAQSADIAQEIQAANENASDSFFSVLSQEQQTEVAQRRKAIQEKLLSLRTGPPIDIIPDAVALGKFYIQAGAIRFNEFARRLYADLGRSIRPHIRAIYTQLRGELNEEGMDTDETIDALDIDEVLREPANRQGRVARTIKRNTGVTIDLAPQNIPERTALKKSLGRQAVAAREGFREGRRSALAQSQAALRALRQKLSRAVPESVALKRSLGRQQTASREGAKYEQRLGVLRTQARSQNKQAVKSFLTDLTRDPVGNRFVLGRTSRDKLRAKFSDSSTPSQLTKAAEFAETLIAEEQTADALDRVNRALRKLKVGRQRKGKKRGFAREASEELTTLRRGLGLSESAPLPKSLSMGKAKKLGLDLESLSALSETALSVDLLDRQSNEISVKKTLKSSEEVVDSSTKELAKFEELGYKVVKVKTKDGVKHVRKPIESEGLIHEFFNEELAKARDLAGEQGDTQFEILYNGAYRADGEQKRYQQDADRSVRFALEAAGHEWASGEAFQWYFEPLTIPGMKTEAGHEVIFSRGQLIEFLAGASDSWIRVRLPKVGFNLSGDLHDKIPIRSEDDILRIEAAATDIEVEFARALKAHVNGKLKAVLSEAFENRNNFAPNLRDDYWMAVRNHKDMDKIPSTITDLMRVTVDGISSLKPRVGSAAPFVFGDAVTHLTSHVKQVGGYIAFAEPIRSAKLLLNSPQYKHALEQHLGTERLKYWNKFIGAMEQQVTGRPELGWLNTRFNHLIHNNATAFLGLNPHTILLQPLAIISAANEIDAKYLIQASPAFNGLSTLGKRVDRDMIEGSSRAWARFNAPRQSLVSTPLDDTGSGEFLGQRTSWKDKIMFGIPLMDRAVLRTIWRGVEIETQEKQPNLNPLDMREKVAEQFDEIVSKTQAAFSVIDQPGIALEARNNPAIAVFNLFMSERSTLFNILRRAVVSKDAKKIAVAITTVAMAEPAYNMALDSILNNLRGKDDDPGESFKLLNYLWEVIEQLVSNIHFGNGLSTMTYLMRQNTKTENWSKDFQLRPGPVARPIEDIFQGLLEAYAVTQEWDEEYSDPKFITGKSKTLDHTLQAAINLTLGFGGVKGFPVSATKYSTDMLINSIRGLGVLAPDRSYLLERAVNLKVRGKHDDAAEELRRINEWYGKTDPVTNKEFDDAVAKKRKKKSG